MIPKIIHQSHRNQEYVNECPTLKYCQDKILKLHKDFEYKFYDDTKMFLYIKNYFPEYYDRFSSLPKKILQCDIFRYFLMYNEGGIYVDMDYLFLKKFDMFNNECLLMLEYYRRENRISNCIFASSPKLFFWKQVIEKCFDTIEKKYVPNKTKQWEIVYLSGPMFLDDFYRKNTTLNNITLVEKELFNKPIFNIIRPYRKQNKLSCLLLEEETVLQKIKKIDKKTYGIHLMTNLWHKKVFLKHETHNYKKKQNEKEYNMNFSIPKDFVQLDRNLDFIYFAVHDFDDKVLTKIYMRRDEFPHIFTTQESSFNHKFKSKSKPFKYVLWNYGEGMNSNKKTWLNRVDIDFFEDSYEYV